MASDTGGAAKSGAAVLAFGAFRLDPANARLTEGARALELAPKAFAVLCHLASRPDLLVTKDELLDAIWGRRFVSESVLKTAVNAIRNVLGDDPRQPRYVETVARRGYRFVGLAPGDTATSTSPAASPAAVPAGTPLIGRIDAAGQLAGWLAAAAAGQRQVVLIGGEAGIGKSTLIRRLAEDALARGAAVAVGQCVEQAGGGEPYLPILDALAELARGPHAETWMAALRQAAPTWLAQLPWLATEVDQARLRRELAGAAPDRMLREFGALLDAATPAHALLLVIEDLHWSDHATVTLLDYLARRRGPGRWMCVASYRPIDLALRDHPMQALRQELRMHRLCHELVLEPFSEREVDAYLLHRFGGRPIPQRAALARALHAHTDGLPLFLANVVDDLESDGGLGRDDVAWADPAATLARLQLPETVVGIVERQLGRLPGDLRDLLEAASVIGLEFSHPLLARMLEQDADALRSRCDGLARRAEWLRAAGMTALPDGALGGRYAFRHALYRRVFYERCAPARRLQLHQRAAEALQALFGTHGERIAAELAQHYEGARDTAAASGVQLAGVARDALAWRLRAARAAVAVHARVDALGHYARAEHAGPEPVERVRILTECAELHQQLGSGAQALAQSAAALDAARALGDPALIQDVMLQRAQLSQQNDNQEETIRLVDELLATEPPLEPEKKASALVAKADALGCIGRLREADDVAREALECLPADAEAARARHYSSRVAVHFQRGEFAPGLAVIEAAFRLHERIGDAVGAAAMVNRRGVFSMLLGNTEAAEAALLDARARTQALNDVQGQRSALLNLIKLRTDRGDAEGSLALLEEGWGLAAGFESPVTECAFLNAFYYCNYLRGDLGGALRDAARVLASAQGLSSVYWRIGSLVTVSGLHIHLGNLNFATELLDHALADTHAREVQHVWQGAATHRAWLDVLAGNATRALARLEEVRASGELVQVEDAAAMARVQAQARLALGEPHAALETLASYDDAPTQEVWALMLALRLQAASQAKTLAAADLERARLELSDRRVPALESLVLRRALVEALIESGDHDAAMAQTALLAAHRDRLAESLAEFPEQQTAFVRAWGANGG